MIRARSLRHSVLSSLLPALLAGAHFAQTLHVDPARGDDANPGTAALPLATIERAVALANVTPDLPADGAAAPGVATTIKLHPGLHVLRESPRLDRTAPYTASERLTIEATVLPDDEAWTPSLMPVIASIEAPVMDGVLCAYGFRINVSHVTIRGVKFVGNPWPGAYYYPVFRDGLDLTDLEVMQCVFVGDRDALPIHLPIIANGHGLVVDHCLFIGCKNSVVFWNGPDDESYGNAMRHCIVDGAYASGVWTCQTASDFEFHHNIITRSRYAWIRENESQRSFRVENSLLTNNDLRAGYGGGAAGALVTTDSDFLELGPRVAETGEVTLVRDPNARDYLHVVPGTPGANLGAGIFLLAE